MKGKMFIVGVLCAVGLAFGANNAAAVPVDLELVLAVDVSGSVDNDEYALQKGGYVQAFQSSAIVDAIQQGTIGKIAVTYVEWSGAGQQSQKVGWMEIYDQVTANAFAAAVNSVTRAFSGLTAPGSAINYAAGLFAGNGFDGTRQVIDVSGDGTQNDGANTATARNNALTGGVDAINGLAIGTQSLLNWYASNIVGGTNAFAIGVNNFNDFASAIDRKLIREITNDPIPEPTTMLLFGTGLAGLAAVGRRREKK